MKQRSSLESSLKPVTVQLRWFHTGVCSSRRRTLIFDIFRIGVVTGYREGMLNLFSFTRLPLLSQFHIVLFYVLLFHVLQFHVLSFGPSFSRPAFSAPPDKVNFLLCLFFLWQTKYDDSYILPGSPRNCP